MRKELTSRACTRLDSDYASEMRLAKECGVDAFAVNYGGYGNDFDTFDQRLELMYQAAHETDFKVSARI